MSLEQQVADHYRHGTLETTILEGLAASGKDVEQIASIDLAGVDEMHLGSRAATAEIIQALELAPTMHVLDVGSGLGGPARHFAEAAGCRVTGIDLTDEYVAVAKALSRRCGLADRVSFRQASALALPFQDATFDAATMIHVGMNVADKLAVFAEVRRVLAPGGRFCVYDVMRAADGDIPYPMPWAATEATSFVEPLSVYRERLAQAGFAIEAERDCSEMVIELGHALRERAAREGPPALGPHTLMGTAARERFGNVMRTLEAGRIAPVRILARKR